MKTLCIIQARMGSTRLPGKVLEFICNKPLLIHVIDRVKKAKNVDEVIVATTNLERDNIIIKTLEQYNIKFYRGSENDVLSRYYEAAKRFNGDIIVRVTSDDPLIDYNHIDLIVEDLIKNNADYSCNNWIKSFPYGLDVECFTMKALERANKEATELCEREHVTPFIRDIKNNFNISYIYSKVNLHNIRLTVDTKEDLEFVKHIYENIYTDNHNFCTSDIINFINNTSK